jgi:hypothetical protein
MATVWNKGFKKSTPCEICGILIKYSKWGRPVKTCSNKCLHELKSKIGKNYVLPSRLGKRVKTAKHKQITTQGYIELYEGDTPIFRQLEHRKVMEHYLGRKLSKREQVHHINHNKTDNGIKNLLLIDISEHTKLHWKEKNNQWQVMM